MLTRLKESRYYRRVRDSDFFPTLVHSQNYFLARMVTVGLAFITLPIFTRLYSQEDYGIVAVYTAYAGIIVVILSANVHTAVGRYYYESRPDFEEFLGTTLILTCIIFFFTTCIFLLFYSEIAQSINLPGFLPFLLIFTSLYTIFNAMYLQFIEAQKKSFESAFLSILRGVLSLGLAIILVLSLSEKRYLGQIGAYLLVGLFFFLYYIRKLFSVAKIAFKKEHVKYILFFSVPMIPYVLSGVILSFFDRIMIHNTIGSASAGIYSLGYTIATLLSIVISATQTALMPDFFKFLNNKQYSRLDVLIKKVFSLITITALGLILFTSEIFEILVDTKFHEGAVVVPMVVLGYVFYGMFTVYGRYIGYVKKTLYSSLVLIIAGISNIVLNMVFIPKYGYIAAAYSTALSYFLLFLMTWFVVKFVLKQKITPLWVVWKPTILLFGFLLILPIVTTVIDNFLILFVVKLGIWGIYGFVLFYRQFKVLYTTKKSPT